MLCISPRMSSVEQSGVKNNYRYACGKCNPCKATKVEALSYRILAESKLWKHCWFVSLTYAPEYLPDDCSIDKKVMQKFLKRLRKYSGDRIKYFLCGEYGKERQRPHYHLIIYGLKPNFYFNKYGKLNHVMLDKAWPFGFHDIAPVEYNNAKYVAKYATKTYTSKEKLELGFRKPEFTLRSKGIGVGYVKYLGDALERDKRYFDGYDGVIHLGDLPGVVRMNGKKFPLDQYMKGKLREYLGGIKPTFIQSGIRAGRIINKVVTDYLIDPDLLHEQMIASARQGYRYFGVSANGKKKKA